MVYFKEAAQRLGARPDQAHSLYAYALALHAYKVSLFPQYRDRRCRLAAWAPPELNARLAPPVVQGCGAPCLRTVVRSLPSRNRRRRALPS
jgi:hypothetical protein